jgi:PKD domain
MLGIAAALIAPAASALAAPQWLAPATISEPGQENTAPKVTFDGEGNIITAWSRGECTGASETHQCSDTRVQVSIRPPGETFAQAQTLPGNAGFGLKLVAGAQGAAALAWTAGSGGLLYAVRPPGQPFGSVQRITDDPGAFQGQPALAMDPSGNVIAFWASGSQTVAHMRWAVAGPGQGFGPVQTIPGDALADRNDTMDLAADGQGGVTAVWSLRDASGREVRYATGTSQGFSDAQSIPGDPGDFASEPRATADTLGNVVAMWISSEGASLEQVRYAVRGPGQPFGAAQTIASPGQASAPHVATAPGGRTVAAWNTNTPDQFFAIREPGGGFGPAQQLPGTDNNSSDPDVAIDPQGAGLAVWAGAAGGTTKVHWSLAPQGQGFSPPQTLEGPPQGASFPQAAFDAQGNAVAIWHGREPGTNSSHDVPILAAGYDAAGPLLRDLSLPAAGEAFQPLSFSVSPVDVWSPVASTRFSFGDGEATAAQASGAQATHSYSAPGTYDVSVTSSDTLGNESSAGGTLQVTDSVAPGVGAFGMTRPRFSVARAATPRTAAKRGSAFRYTLSEPATVAIAIQRPRPGRRAGARCVKPRRSLRKRRRCTRHTAVGRLTRLNRPAGANRTAFSGRIGKRALKPRRYRATLIATDASGNRSRPARVKFRIVGRRR